VPAGTGSLGKVNFIHSAALSGQIHKYGGIHPSIHPGWQGVETQEYQAYFEFSQRSQAGWIDR
jgi:hypothetical protein